jgi:2-keto-3-deoxy-L-rhamnonate aldolase RhmA
MNSFKAFLMQQPITWAVNVGGASVDSIDMLATAGVRCIFIDCERTAIHIESVRPMVLAAKNHGMFTMLRSENQQAETLIRYLDRGIDAIVVPHTETVEELKMIAEVVDYVSKGQKDKFMTIAQIESVNAVNHIQSLATSAHVDSFLIGPNDLSHSMGFKGNLQSDALWQAIDRVIQELQSYQRIWGIPGLPESQPKFSEQGAKYLYCTLSQIIQQGFKPFHSVS